MTAADDIDLALPRPAAPSPTQSHGTVMVALLAGFVVLGVLLALSVRGVGPFTGRIVSVENLSELETRVTVTVANEGRKPGRAKCRIERIGQTGDLQPEHPFLSERVPAHGAVTQTVLVPVRPDVRLGQVSC
jgi:hypothetical protein